MGNIILYYVEGMAAESEINIQYPLYHKLLLSFDYKVLLVS